MTSLIKNHLLIELKTSLRVYTLYRAHMFHNKSSTVKGLISLTNVYMRYHIEKLAEIKENNNGC